MRNSIFTSQYGDHFYNEDHTVLVLEKMAAELLGKEAASFVPSGVFGNQCSILTAGRPGTGIAVGELTHMILYENGSIGKIGRMLTRMI
jgi:threonine aldolase